MAKHTVKIQPASLGGDSGLICAYYDVIEKKTFAILQNDDVVVNPGKDALIKAIKFTADQPTHIIEYDDKNPDDKRFKQQVDWWKRHPETLDVNATKKHSNMVRMRFTLIDIGEQVDNQAKLIENVGKVLEKLMAAGPAGRVKIATFYGVTGATTKKDGDLVVELGAIPAGKLMNPKIMWNEKQQISCMEHFLNDYKGDSAETTFKVNVRRAVALSLIEVRNNTPGKPLEMTYYINNDPVATSEDALIVYLKEHEDLYNTYVLTRLQADKEEKKQLADNQLKANKGEKTEIEERKHAQSLGIQGWHSMKIEKLRGLIKEKEEPSAVAQT